MNKNHKGPVPHKVFSDRGSWLDAINQSEKNRNINHDKPVVIDNDVTVRVGQRCPSCKFKVRGLNHAEGMHHRGIIPRRKRR